MLRKGLPWAHFSLSRVMWLVLSVTLISAIALCLLAWRLSVLDQAVARQRDRERLDHAADSGSGALLQRVNETGERLRTFLDSDSAGRSRLSGALTAGCISCRAILIKPGLAAVSSETQLRYVPDPPQPAAIDNRVFDGGEALEFGRRDHRAAARWFLELAGRSAGTVRAGALVRAARNFAKQKESAQALAAWSSVEQLGDLQLNGEACDLVARFARLPLLGADAKQDEARRLQSDLDAGRWHLSRASYEFYSGELSKLAGVKSSPPVWEEAVYSISQFVREEHIDSGERVIHSAASAPVLLAVWRTRGETTAALVFTAADIRAWLARVPGFGFGLETLDGEAILQTPRASRTPNACCHLRMRTGGSAPPHSSRRANRETGRCCC